MRSPHALPAPFRVRYCSRQSSSMSFAVICLAELHVAGIFLWSAR
ncbi:hypothetical protein [Streptomyces sp. NPDC001083]